MLNGTDDDRIILALIVAITVVVVVDILAAVAVRVIAHDTPVVSGDVAKVGIGALGGLAAGIAMAIKMRR
jgi:hypothetical protein